MAMQWMVGVDTGGTFTDLIAVSADGKDVRLAKVSSVPEDPSVAVINALKDLIATGVSPGQIGLFVHGTTVATNALIEMKGARTGLLITKGFRAVYETRGRTQPSAIDLLDTSYTKPPLLAPQRLTEEVTGRIGHKGDELQPLDEDALRQSVRLLLAKKVDSIAVCYLFSYVNPAHEARTAEIIAEEAPGIRISLSSQVLPVIREYPRLSTTVIDAYVGPAVQTYLLRLVDRLRDLGLTTPQLYVMQSNGGIMRIADGARYPNQTLLSGPAAGVMAGYELARLTKRPHLITFDMGGTSTDISVIADGRVAETTEGQLMGQDIGTPMLKVRTLGAGGGTIAWIGPDGGLKVGPRSAGAVPGPACYGRGGEMPTVTDANAVLGGLSGESVLAGKLRLDVDASRRAIQTHIGTPLGLDLVQAAAGIIKIVNTHMAIDLRAALREEGQDPRFYALVAFGGAGPLHASELARMVGIPRVILPPYPGIACAMGLLMTKVKHVHLRSTLMVLSKITPDQIETVFGELSAAAMAEAREEGFRPEDVELLRQVELRYPHQKYQLTVDCPEGPITDETKRELKRRFDELHRTLYGQAAVNEDAELVTYRIQAEMTVPRLELNEQPASDARPKPHGTRPLYDCGLNGGGGGFAEAGIYLRTELAPGMRLDGPAIIEQFDATTALYQGQSLVVDPYGTLLIETGAGA
jgi:N-methylhydantoinase A